MFDELGICPDSTVAVHTSLKSIGGIEGGARGCSITIQNCFLKGFLLFRLIHGQ